MNTQERIAKLEGILARVTDRAKAPRGVSVQVAEVSSHVDPAESATPEVQARDARTSAPAPAPAAPPLTPPPPSVDVEVEVVDVKQVSEPPISIDVSSDDEVESSERGVSPADEPRGEVAEEPLQSVVPAEVAAEASADFAKEPERVPEPEPEPEHTPEPPASSRRPIALESKLEDLAFGDVAPPEALHTPPPESGRQVASPADLDFDSDFTGVRSKENDEADVEVVHSPPPPPLDLPTSDVVFADLGPSDVAAADLAPADLAPVAPVELARVELPSGEHPSTDLVSAEPAPVEEATPSPVESAVVASAPEVILATLPETPAAIFEGSAKVFKPATFGELLEATLAL